MPTRKPSGRRRASQARSKATVERILDSAAALIVEKGADGVTMTEIARRSNVVVGSLYQYFADKSAINRALLVRHHEEVRRMLQGYLSNVGTFNDFMAAIEAAAANGLEEAAIKKTPSAWQYGYGEFEEAAKQVKNFLTLPYFNGEAWQGGKAWPDEKLGWAQLTPMGGHAGNDLQHAVIRRWVAPLNGTVAIEGTIKHEHKEGDGIRACIYSSRKGLLGNWVLHDQKAEAKVENLEVKQGDTVDFVVSIHQSLNNNDFLWAPVIRMVGPTAIRDANGYAREWNAAKEFAGPPGEERKPLTAWEQYAQVLLLSNEFLFVD